MATYIQWAKTSTLKPLAWVCGPEPVLVRAVTGAYREDTPADCQVVLSAGDTAENLVWDALLGDPLPGFPRLSIVLAAEKLKSTQVMAQLAASASADGPRAVFVSADADFPRDGKDLAPHLAALQKSRHGQLIRCCAPSKSEDLVSLVCAWWPGLSRNLAWQVLRRSDGDLTRAAGACGKAVRAGLEPSEASVLAVSEPEPGAAFADALVAGKKGEAMAAARQAGRGDTGYGLAVLASRLDQLAVVHDALKSGVPQRDLSARVHVSRWQAGQLAPHAPSYDVARVARCRELLAMAESRHRAGAAAGVAQAVVACW